MLRIAFRVDSSQLIGSGHVMRCLTLADALSEHGAKCLFIHRAQDGHMAETIRKRGHTVRELPAPTVEMAPRNELDYESWLGVPVEQDALQTREALGDERPNWLVVDHYALDATWEAELRPAVGAIAVLDDLANRPHDCDLLIDQNLGVSADRYSALVTRPCPLLIGPRFALLRPEFARLRKRSLERRRSGTLKRILVSMGGVDKDNATGYVLKVLAHCSLDANSKIEVIMGSNAPWTNSVSNLVDALPYTAQLTVGASDMAQRMLEADLAIGAAGSTSWERCCLGLPTVSLITAANQRRSALALEKLGAIVIVEHPVRSKTIEQNIHNFSSKPKLLRETSIKAAKVTDGLGCKRVKEQLLEIT